VEETIQIRVQPYPTGSYPVEALVCNEIRWQVQMQVKVLVGVKVRRQIFVRVFDQIHLT
jgi:hypothetical protein